MSDTKRNVQRIVPNANPVTEDTLAELRRLVPGAVVEGKVDFDKLRAALGDTVETRPERYSFSWAGKSDAIRLLQVPSRATLIPASDEGVNPDTTENLFIEGDNLEVLKLLYKPYFGRVKMIYIDPPYNTGHDFVYPDNYADPLDAYLKMTGQKDSDGNLLTSNPETSGRYHSAWLSMMYPRLFLARQLLRDDGVIFISIDDHEVTNLRMVMNEIFGEENFVCQVVVQLNPRGRTLDKFFAKTHEYLLVYGRNAEEHCVGELTKIGAMAQDYSKSDERGSYRLLELRNRNPVFNRTNRPKLYFPFYVNPESGQVALEHDQNHTIEVYPLNSSEQEGCWTWGIQKARQNLPILVARKVSTGAWRVFRKDYLIKDTGDISTTKEKALWIDKDINNEKGKEVLRDLFGEHLFDFPKSVYLVLKMAKIATASSEEHIVLDFFAGSCTTAHAVMQLNKEDGGNRRFICVQLPEPTKNKEYPTIAEIGKERIRRAIKKLSEPAAEGDLVAAPATADQARPGFNVFKLTASNFKPWTGVAEDDPDAYARQMELYLDPLVNQWQALDVIWEIAIKEGFGLTARVAPVENIKSNAVYHVHDADKNQSFHICLDARLAAATPRALALGKDDLFICRDIALDDELAANLALQCRLKTI